MGFYKVNCENELATHEAVVGIVNVEEYMDDSAAVDAVVVGIVKVEGALEGIDDREGTSDIHSHRGYNMDKDTL